MPVHMREYYNHCFDSFGMMGKRIPKSVKGAEEVGWMTSEALVTSPFGVGAVITSLIALSFWLDRRFRFFSRLGTAILVITGGAVLVNLGMIPSTVGEAALNPVYIFASDYGVPLAIVLLLLATDFGEFALWAGPRWQPLCWE